MAIMNSKRNSSNQFVVTSHEIELLDQPLRSDQIWFVNKSFKMNRNYTPYLILQIYKRNVEIFLMRNAI